MLIDGEAGASDEEEEKIRDAGKDTIIIWNKIDRVPGSAPDGTFSPSVRSQEKGLPPLRAKFYPVYQGADWGGCEFGGAVIDSRRQRDLLDRAARALGEVETGLTSGAPLDAVAVDVREALDALGEITGDVASADILESMFSSFCVGK